MRARFAYISSLGTTAILVAAALLMLAVVSAIVAFRGWPGAATGSGAVQSIPLAPHGGAERVALVRRVPAAASGVELSTTSRAAPKATRSAASAAGLVKRKARGPRVVPGLVMEPVVAAPMQPQPSSPSRGGQQAGQAAPATEAAPARPVADQPGAPVTGGGGLTIPVPVPVPPPPGDSPNSGPVGTLVGSLLGGSTPPPPLLDTVALP